MTSPLNTSAELALVGQPLSCAQILAMAKGELRPVFPHSSAATVAVWSAHADRVAAARPIYGRSTGVGANRSVPVTDSEGQALRLLRSHATSAGELRSAQRVRGMLAVRLNQFAAGGNGVRLEVVQALATMIANDELPPIREYGSIGTGDLSALATTALALIGDPGSGRRSTVSCRFLAGDALPFISSNAATIADAAIAVAELRQLLDSSLIVAALTWCGVNGNGEAFAPAVEAATPFVGAIHVMRRMRELSADASRSASRIQDPYGLRTLPQVTGAAFDALENAERVIAAMSAAPAENPALHPTLGTAHHGSFYASHLEQAMDGVRLSLIDVARMCVRRITMLSEPTLTGDQPFLSDGTPGASGVMIVEYVAAAAAAEVADLSMPTALQTVTLSRGLEEGATFAALSAKRALDITDPLRLLSAAELLCASRLLSAADNVPTVLAQVLRRASADSARPDDRADRDLTGDLDSLVRRFHLITALD